MNTGRTSATVWDRRPAFVMPFVRKNERTVKLNGWEVKRIMERNGADLADYAM